MSHESRSTVEVSLTGPYGWPKYEAVNNLTPLPRHPGLYLWTFECDSGYLIYCAGITRRPIPARFREHTKKFMGGDYTVLDVATLKNGIRKEVWHGWGWTQEKRAVNAAGRPGKPQADLSGRSSSPRSMVALAKPLRQAMMLWIRSRFTTSGKAVTPQMANG